MSGDVLVQAEDVSFGVFELTRFFRAQHADVFDRHEPREVVIGKLDAARLQRSDGVADAVDLETERRMLGLRPFGLREQRDFSAAAARSV